MIYTVEVLKGIIDKHKAWLNSEDNGSRADLSRANLSRANLSGADLSRANLSGAKSDFSILLSLSGMNWLILIKDDLVKVGCQEHKYSVWKSFIQEEISKMDIDALDFYNGILIKLLDYQFKGTQFEIKENL
jgi:uncharacterized protein YjbI with pentapeptide repeats